METTTAKTEGMASVQIADLVYEAAGKVGDYLQDILADTMYYAGKYVAYVRDVCAAYQLPLGVRAREDGKITIMSLVNSHAVVEEADRREFYLNFGRDMVEMTKSGLESDNLTIIDLSRYNL